MSAEAREYPRGAWHGESRVVALNNALAGGGITYEFGGEWVYQVEAVCLTLTTAAGGGARFVTVLLIDSTGAVVYAVSAPNTQGGGLTVRYSFAPFVTAFGSASLGAMGAPFPSIDLPGNVSLQVGVASAEAGDAITDGRLIVKQRWPRDWRG